MSTTTYNDAAQGPLSQPPVPSPGGQPFHPQSRSDESYEQWGQAALRLHQCADRLVESIDLLPQLPPGNEHRPDNQRDVGTVEQQSFNLPIEGNPRIAPGRRPMARAATRSPWQMSWTFSLTRSQARSLLSSHSLPCLTGPSRTDSTKLQWIRSKFI